MMTAILVLAAIGLIVGVLCLLILLAIATEVHDHYTDAKYWAHQNRLKFETQSTTFAAFKKSVDHNFYNARKRDTAIRTAITEKFKSVTGPAKAVTPIVHVEKKIVAKSNRKSKKA